MADNETQVAQAAQPEQSKVKHHINKHSKKYGLAAIAAMIVAGLQLFSAICPMLPFKLQCPNTQQLQTTIQTTSQGLQDAGIDL